MLYSFALVVLGFAILIWGAELCVRGASRIAENHGVSKTLIGITIVAFGTSLPEMIISFIASIQGESSIAAGNVIGSNIANIALIIGSAALLQPLITNARLMKREIPLMLFSSLIIFIFSVSGVITRLDGFILLLGFVFFMWLSLRRYKKEKNDIKIQKTREHELFKNIIMTIIGFVFLVIGGHWVVVGGKNIAVSYGISEWIIGLTIVALGTSLPELATSIVAAYRKELEISLGNVIGSNLFNSFFVLGGATMIRPAKVQHSDIYRDIIIMIFVSILITIFAKTGMKISRFEGAILLSIYILFIISLILNPTWSLF